MNFPKDLKYTNNDEWLRVEGDVGVIGVTDYAQDQLSDIVFVEYLVDEGDALSKGDACITVESVKAAADVYTPVSGDVVAINESLPDAPEMVNSEPYDSWMIKIKLSDPAEVEGLLDANTYENLERDH